MTALMWAAACGHLSLAQFLVKEKADVNAKDIDGRGLGWGEVGRGPFFTGGIKGQMQGATHWARFVGGLCGSRLVSFFGRVQAGRRQKQFT